MQYLAERTRQALGLGDRDFHPTSLEAERRAVQEASVFGHHLHTLERSVAKWSAATDEVLVSAGRFLADAPRPRHFTQSDPSDPGTLIAAPPELPREFENLNQPSLVRRLAGGAPLVVGDMLQRGLQEPIAVWLAALDAAKERLSRLEHHRIRQDVARRALHTAARAEGADTVGDPAHEHLILLEQEHEPVMSEFRDAQEALDRHLSWLADQAARLKAAVVSAVQTAHVGSLRGGVAPPEGLLLEFPKDLLERPETMHAAAVAAPAGPGGAATAAAMTEAAVEAATVAAISASGLDVPLPQLVMLGPDVPAAAETGGGGVTDVTLVVPPGTAGVAAEAAVEAAEAVALAAEALALAEAHDSAMAGPRELKESERVEERLLQGATTGGPAAARLHKLVTRPARREAVRNAWRVLVHRAMYDERHKTLSEHAEEQMRDVKERAGLTGGFLMRPEAAPEYVMAGRRRLPGGGPLQFLRDTILGPTAGPDDEPHHHRGVAAAAAAAGGSGAGLPSPHTAAAPTAGAAATSPPAAAPAAGVDYAAAAREQMEEVAAHGTGGAAAGPDAALTSPPDTGVMRFLEETVIGPRRDDEQRLAETLTGPPPAAGAEVLRDTAELPYTSGGTALPAAVTADLAAAAREQMEEVAAHGIGGVTAAAGAGRTPSGGPASFIVDTLMGPEAVLEPGPGSYVPYPLPAAQPLVPEGAAALPEAVTVYVETYEGLGMTAMPPEYPQVPYEPLAGPASVRAAESASAAAIAADAAMDVSSASAEAAAAAAEAAAAAMEVAAVAMDAATEAQIAAIDAESAELEASETPSTPPRRGEGATRGAGVAATLPADIGRAYGAVGAGGPTGPGSGSASDEEAAAAAGGGEAGSPAASGGGTGQVAGGVPVESLDLPDFSRLDIEKHGRCGVPAELPQYAKQYGKVGAGGPPGEVVAATPTEATAPLEAAPGYEAFSGADLTSFGLPPEGGGAAGPPASTVTAMAEPMPPERLPEVPTDVGRAAVSEQLGRMHLESFGLEPTEGVEVPEAAEVEAEAESGRRLGGEGEEVEAEGRGAAGGGGEGGAPTGVFGALKKMVEEEVIGHGGEGKTRGEGFAEEPAGPTPIDV